MVDLTATAVTTRAVRPGRLDAFRAWADRVDAGAAARPGFAGLIRLEQAGGLHHLVHRFHDTDALAAWQASDAHRALIAQGARDSVGLYQCGTGDHVHLTLPSETGGKKWKTFLVSWLAVLPVLLAVSSAIRALLPGLPPVAQTAISSVLLTGALTTVIQPRVQRWSRFWLLRDADGTLRTATDSG